MSNLENNRKTKTMEKPQLLSLPHDLLISCLARIPRLYYPILYLVSKRFSSLLASPELYQARSSLGRTETCLYVCLWFPPDPNPRWYTLCRRPSRTQTNILVPVSILNSPCVHTSSIFKIGANKLLFYSVFYCQRHMRDDVQNKLVQRVSPSTHVIDGKIYVSEYILSNSKDGRWDDVRQKIDSGRECLCYCVIENVLYRHLEGVFEWYDTKVRDWRKLDLGLPDSVKRRCVKLADYGGKMAVFWNMWEPIRPYNNKVIWCAVIRFERSDNDEEILGKNEWCDEVLTINLMSYEFVCAVAATV